VIGVLLFQDLAVVPFLVVIPVLALGAEESGRRWHWPGSRPPCADPHPLSRPRLMQRWFFMVAQRKSPELFMLNVLLVTLGMAFATELAGLSLALGAFLAGMLISETQYRYQVEEDIKPFRDVLLGLFFVTVGMRLDVPHIPEQWWLGGGHPGALLAGKLVWLDWPRAFGKPRRERRCAAALWLCAGGEFGFVLILARGGDVGRLLGTELLQPVLAALVLSLLLAPLIVHFSPSASCCASSPRNGCCGRCN
jgi:CPA2 family monovalent cation:H+ antiporter-2